MLCFFPSFFVTFIQDLGYKLQRMKEDRRKEKESQMKKLKEQLMDGLQKNVDKHLQDLYPSP